MEARPQGDGRLAEWLGTRLGGDAALGERAWRRILHAAGAFVLLYFVLPPDFFIVVSTTGLLLILLAGVLVLEAARHVLRFHLGLVRPYEEGRVGSYAWYAVALTVAVLLFPAPVATVVVLGVALVDPLTGELRRLEHPRRYIPLVPIATYTLLGLGALAVGFHWAPVAAFGVAFVLGVVAVTVEQWRIPWVDDDFTMTVVPGILGAAWLYFAPSLPTLGASSLG
jgi:hypothetical protein